MIKDKPFIHLFKTPGSYYIYDVNTNAILSVDKDVFDFLEYKMDSNTSKEVDWPSEIVEFIDNGFLSSNKIKEIEHSDTDLLPDILSNNVPRITLQITQQCNLRCKYCIYSGSYSNRHHSKKNMSFETAKKGIDFLINHSNGVNEINIGFYGGEPLLEFKFIKKCVEYAEEQAEGKDISFNITSNGTIINREIIEYFDKHNIILMISLDGPKEIQDRNRQFAMDGKGTFEKVIKNVEFIKSEFPEYFKKVTFNAVMDSRNNFNCSSEFFTTYETFKDSLVNVSLVSDGYSEETVDSEISDEFIFNQEYEIFKLFLSKFNRLDEENVSKLIRVYINQIKLDMYDKRTITHRLPDKVHHGGPCIPGVQRLFMNADGNLFPCERVSELSSIMNIGNVNDGFYIDNVSKLLNVGKITEEKCKNCWCFRFCGLCAASADHLDGFSEELKTSHCSATANQVEEMMKDYCTLVEFGYKFSDNDKEIIPYTSKGDKIL
ncbi:Cys-rich peptide radical SAM maturase CcpM [Clostridium butyricum]|uniref:Cys-rich peptide radical SAM maturase CcpM n=1 Tax=Clostridium butyricum TaxID=1492 RepID=A0A0A6SCA5_CLOBU|nr:Cys-rich peptide radical SAM maturase CcpM [Clostridium butyricum]KHD13716.1 radical SAM protein [Clostridium butyricum]KHD15702.1 radical SAM protein [Clostridium butyricum]PPV12132.1 Cys-rich peptide radical SAM maturase CcpM [Clostridium butyricum]